MIGPVPVAGMLRACEYRLPDEGLVVIEIPRRSSMAERPQVVSEFKLRASLADQPLCPPPAGQPGLGLALDIGTTTVAALLVDLHSREVLAEAAQFNRQIQLGDDVLTRINLCRIDTGYVQQLQSLLFQDTLIPLVGYLLKEAEGSLNDLHCVVAAGNTTMLHLLAGVDPGPLGAVPFTPSFLDHQVLTSEGLSLAADSSAPVHLLPGASGYVGADIVAGIVATAMANGDGPNMLVDIGTNGEIVLWHDGHFLGCATAAGPAFEGSGLLNGVRASQGAISHLSFEDDRLQVEVIGDGKPFGICGSAYVDFLAEGRVGDLLTRTGRFRRSSGFEYSDHGKQGRGISLGVSRDGADLDVTEFDVATLLQAKAAIAAGIMSLLARAELVPSDIQTLYLAGGFGLHLKLSSAIGCGLLPGFTSEQIQVVGNTSLAGAYAALLDQGALEEMNRVSGLVEIVELNLEPDFENRYIDEMILP